MAGGGRPFVNSPTLGDLLKFELNGNYTRETVTLKAGTDYALGSVLGRITASAKYRLQTTASSVEDGMQLCAQFAAQSRAADDDH